jgi:membrane protease YdiL (CAAX protease family)
VPRAARALAVAPFSVAALSLAAFVVAGRPAPAHAQGAPAPTLADPMAPVPAELLARAASPDPRVRVAAVLSLQALATPAAWNLVLAQLQRDYDPRVRASAATALGASHDPQMRYALEAAAHVDPDPAVRAAAEASRAAVAPFAKRPKAAAGFSALCPGCGYFYLGETERALAYLGAGVGLVAAAVVALDRQTDSQGHVIQQYPGRATPFLMGLQNLWLYGIFASYRDARLARGDLGAKYPVAREDLGELLFAPFNPKVLKSPWVWAGLPALLGGAWGMGYLYSRVSGSSAGSMTRTLGDGKGVQFFGSHYGTGAGVALGETYNLGLFLPVGIGEEATFRGVIQAGLSETSLDLWGGWAVGSLLFGALHTLNFVGSENGAQKAALAVPYITLTGSYLGYLYIHSRFSLAQGVAVHFWYDFLLSTFDFIADPDHQPFVARFATPF